MMTCRMLDAAVAIALAEFYSLMHAGRGDPPREAEAWRRLVARVVSLRREAGHLEPTLLLAEILILEGWGAADPTFEVLAPSDAEAERWTLDVQAAIAALVPGSRARPGRRKVAGRRR